MPVLHQLAIVLIVALALYFIVLGVAALIAPAKASKYLLGFAASAPLHYLELTLRLLAGGALIVHAPHMAFADVFSAFGWLLVLTTGGLLLVPWQQHRRFAEWAVPQALRFIALIGISSLVLGCATLAALALR